MNKCKVKIPDGRLLVATRIDVCSYPAASIHLCEDKDADLNAKNVLAFVELNSLEDKLCIAAYQHEADDPILYFPYSLGLSALDEGYNLGWSQYDTFLTPEHEAIAGAACHHQMQIRDDLTLGVCEGTHNGIPAILICLDCLDPESKEVSRKCLAFVEWNEVLEDICIGCFKAQGSHPVAYFGYYGRAQQLLLEHRQSYGAVQCEKIRKTLKGEPASDYEKYVLKYGYKHKTVGALKAAYGRQLKGLKNIMLSREEFLAETEDNQSEATYDALAALVNAAKLEPKEVLRYVRFRWCLRDAKAIVAYQISPLNTAGCWGWAVNTCDTEIDPDLARLKASDEFGFEIGRIKIIGTPYYEATDWNFIRFDCAGWSWLMKDSELYQIYK